MSSGHAPDPAALRARLSAFKIPTVWLVVSDPADVPRSPTGKVVKQDLQRLVRSRGTPTSRVPGPVRGARPVDPLR